MKVVYKKDIEKKYTCQVCSTQFNWDKNSSRYGNYEGSGKNVFFCSDKCGKNWMKTTKNK